MAKCFTTKWLLEWTIHLCIGALGLFLYHAFHAWGSWLAFFGLVLLVGTLASLGIYGAYHAAREMALDGEDETDDLTKPK
jgi:hypothetical protein